MNLLPLLLSTLNTLVQGDSMETCNLVIFFEGKYVTKCNVLVLFPWLVRKCFLDSRFDLHGMFHFQLIEIKYLRLNYFIALKFNNIFHNFEIYAIIKKLNK